MPIPTFVGISSGSVLDYQLKKLPVLEVDGKPLPDSIAIARYLGSNFDI